MNYKQYYSENQKHKSYGDVIFFTNKMIDGILDIIILSINPLVIFNL